jgi:hypothetical protein
MYKKKLTPKMKAEHEENCQFNRVIDTVFLLSYLVLIFDICRKPIQWIKSFF